MCVDTCIASNAFQCIDALRAGRFRKQILRLIVAARADIATCDKARPRVEREWRERNSEWEAVGWERGRWVREREGRKGGKERERRGERERRY